MVEMSKRKVSITQFRRLYGDDPPSRSTVLNWVRDGILPAVQPAGRNGKIYILVDDVDASPADEEAALIAAVQSGSEQDAQTSPT